MWWYAPGHMGAWGWVGMVLGTLLSAALLVAVALLVVRAVRRPDGDPAPPRSPEQVLAERYARGEIDEEDLRRRLDTLRRTGGGSS